MINSGALCRMQIKARQADRQTDRQSDRVSSSSVKASCSLRGGAEGH